MVGGSAEDSQNRSLGFARCLLTHAVNAPRQANALWVAVATVGLLTAAPAVASYASPPPSPTSAPTVDARGGESIAMPKMRAWTYIVADADTGAVLGGRDWHWKLPPASTMKTLTALSLVNRLQLDSQYRARKVDVQAEGSKVGLKKDPSTAYGISLTAC